MWAFSLKKEKPLCNAKIRWSINLIWIITTLFFVFFLRKNVSLFWKHFLLEAKNIFNEIFIEVGRPEMIDKQLIIKEKVF